VNRLADARPTGARTEGTARSDLAVTLLFSAASFLGAGLLFAVQPMVTRMLLPNLGGSPAAWNTAMVFFQSALLLGYVVAHVSIGRLGIRRHTVLQVGLLVAAAVTLPIALPAGWVAPAASGTELWTLGTLVVMVGAPFAVLSTTSPTLQRWLAETDHRAASDPYFLYAAGNAGSLLALLGYPLLIDRVLGVQQQARAWAVGFVALILLTALCAAVTRSSSRPIAAGTDGPVHVPISRWANPAWILPAAIPSALLLGTTRHLGTDVASIPLLWVVPLAIYLGTFVLAFSSWGPTALRWGTTLTAAVALPAVLAWIAAVHLRAWPLLLHLLALTAVALLAHGRLAASRPPADQLTGFYVALSVGGALGGAAAALVAPVVFHEILEYPIALVAGVALLPVQALRRWAAPSAAASLALVILAVAVAGWQLANPGFGLALAGLCTVTALLMVRLPVHLAVVGVVLLVVFAQVQERSAVRAERTFFGVTRVEDNTERGIRHLVSGTTIHGSQVMVPEPDTTPISYYHAEGPVGRVITESLGAEPVNIGVIGLGAGTLASYLRPGDRMTFYEIDPAVVRTAQDPELFTFLSSARGTVEVQLGDGRLLVDRSDQLHHVLVVDAFSSDAIPIHLLTVEAFDVYLDSLAPGGVIAIHISNRYFDLEPPVAAAGAAVGLDVRELMLAPDERHAAPSRWMVMARPGALPAVATGPQGRIPRSGNVWTDDRSDLLSTLVLRR
jgi:hypothetical protein